MTDSSRGQTATIGIVLLLMLVFLGAALIALNGMSLTNALQEQTSREQADQVLEQVDSDLSTLTFSGKDSTQLNLDADAENYEVNDGGTLSIEVRNRFGMSCSKTTALGELMYEDGQQRIGYQAGGRWRKTADGSTVVSAPEIRYIEKSVDNDTRYSLDLAVTNVTGSVTNGEHTASHRTDTANGDDLRDCMRDDSFGYPAEVTIEVADTPYHDAWKKFFRDEFDVDASTAGGNRVEHEPGDRTVRVHATLGPDRPFSDYVDLEPTVYGGLYVTSGPQGKVMFGQTLTVDAYDSRHGAYDANSTNVMDDFFVVDADTLDLKNHATVSGYSVVNGDLHLNPHTEVSAAFAHGITGSTNPTDVTYFEINESFDSIDSVDDDIVQANEYLEGAENPATTQIDNGTYQTEDLALEGATIDTTDGDVHVGVTNDLELGNVDVVGSGQVHFYVEGSIDVENVDVPDDDASSLWIYGTETSDVSVGGTFEGVVYAPGHGDLEIAGGTEVYGAIVGGTHDGDIGNDVEVHFDESIRKDAPIPQQKYEVVEKEEGERPPANVTFVLDQSGSMSENDPDGIRADATKDVIGMLDDDHDYAGVFEFNESGTERHELSGDFSSVNESVRAITGGDTDMSAGMELALEEYDENINDSRTRHMILLSDGENTVDWVCTESFFGWCIDGYYESAERTRTLAEEAASERNVTIHTVALGDDAEEELLTYVADVTGGQNYTADNAEELESIFQDVGGGIVETSIDRTITTVTADADESGDEYSINFVEHDIEIDSS